MTIPIPPSHCSVDLHIRIALGALFKSPIMVDPVVVIPDMLSKKASLKVNSRSERINGNDPKVAIPITINRFIKFILKNIDIFISYCVEIYTP